MPGCAPPACPHAFFHHLPGGSLHPSRPWYAGRALCSDRQAMRRHTHVMYMDHSHACAHTHCSCQCRPSRLLPPPLHPHCITFSTAALTCSLVGPCTCSLASLPSSPPSPPPSAAFTACTCRVTTQLHWHEHRPVPQGSLALTARF
jgi:hypothetical protein